MGRSQLLPIALDDLACGFDVVERSGVAVFELGGGLFAFKIRGCDGSIEYVTCDENLSPLYAPARSLAELKQRFTHARRERSR